MTNSKHIASLDEVLADYAQASRKFDPKVLQTFVQKFPEHASSLQRYAHIQMTSAPASAEELAREEVGDEELLPLQSKLLQRLQELRGSPSDAEVDQAVSRLAKIADSDATDAAAAAVFGSCEHGEDILFLTITESGAPIESTPSWVYARLGGYVGASMPVVQAALAKRGHVARQQRHSSRTKPVHSPPMTWKDAVEQCITDEATRKAILERADDA